MMINHTLSYSYDKKGKHYFNINTYGATKAEIYEALIHKNTKNKVNKVYKSLYVSAVSAVAPCRATQVLVALHTM